jgi:hypothetical protein
MLINISQNEDNVSDVSKLLSNLLEESDISDYGEKAVK